MMPSRSVKCWAILWRSNNALDGEQSHMVDDWRHPSRTELYTTRQEAREATRTRYGYIANRPDLRAEPHGWRMPVPVRVQVTIEGAN